MRSKLKIILMTVVCTTCFWAVLIIAMLWYFSTPAPNVHGAQGGNADEWWSVFFFSNQEPKGVTVLLKELPRDPTNHLSEGTVLNRLEIPPRGELNVGFLRVRGGTNQ